MGLKDPTNPVVSDRQVFLPSGVVGVLCGETLGNFEILLELLERPGEVALTLKDPTIGGATGGEGV